MALSNLPRGVSPSHPHFHEGYPPDVCPDCGESVGDDVYCENCGTALDPDEAAAIAEELEGERMSDWERGR